jgi:UPF0271 protein
MMRLRHGYEQKLLGSVTEGQDVVCYLMSEKVLVLDSSAFIMGYDPFSIKQKQFTTPAIGGELRIENVIWLRFTMACETGTLELLSPSPNAMKAVKERARSTGDLGRLSDVDVEVLAVAEELRQRGFSPILISDDYSIQNVADLLGLEYTSLSTLGIRHRFRWVQYCPACHRKYPSSSSIKTCVVCGTPLKRKPVKKALRGKQSQNKAAKAEM